MDGGPRRVFDVRAAGGLQGPASTRSSRATARRARGPASSFPEPGEWCSIAVKAVSNRPGSVRAKSRYAWPTARSRRRAPLGVCRRARTAHPVGHVLSELFERGVAYHRKERVAVGEVPIGGIGTTPTKRVTSRRTTASGPPERASSRPASTRAARTMPRGRGPRRVRPPRCSASVATVHDYSGHRPQLLLLWTASTYRPRHGSAC